MENRLDALERKIEGIIQKLGEFDRLQREGRTDRESIHLMIDALSELIKKSRAISIVTVLASIPKIVMAAIFAVASWATIIEVNQYFKVEDHGKQISNMEIQEKAFTDYISRVTHEHDVQLAISETRMVRIEDKLSNLLDLWNREFDHTQYPPTHQ